MRSVQTWIWLFFFMIVGSVVWSPAISDSLPNVEININNLQNDLVGNLQRTPESGQTLPMINESMDQYSNKTGDYIALGNTVINFLNNDSMLFDNRKSSILATFLTVSTLMDLNATVALRHKDGVFQFLSNRLDSTNHFVEDIPYAHYKTQSLQYIMSKPYTYNLTHQMALWTLGKLGLLTRFSQSQIDFWINELQNYQHADGGWGDHRYPNASLFESYFAVGALKTLCATKELNILPSIQDKLQSFLRSHQVKATEQWGFPWIGMFQENKSSLAYGWGEYVIDWCAVNLIEMIGSDYAYYSASFADFINNNEVFNPTTRTFADWITSTGDDDCLNYAGTALIGDCLYGLNLQSAFEAQINEATTILLNSLEDGKRFVWWYRYNDHDSQYTLSAQYYIMHYLARANKLNLIPQSKRDFLTQDYEKFFTLDGGASYQHNTDPSLNVIEAFANYAGNFQGVNTTHLFETIFCHETRSSGGSQGDGYYFDDQEWINYSSGMSWNQIFRPHEAEMASFFKTNYYGFKALKQFHLLDKFYSVTQWRFEYYERMPKQRFLADGSFYGHYSFYQKGDLESTFYALATQKILLDYDLRGFDYYYSPQELISIRNYVLSFVTQDANYWYARCPSSSTYCGAFGLSDYAATYFVQQILEMLGYSGDISYAKLTNYISGQLANMKQYAIEIQTDLYKLIRANLNRLTLNPDQMNHLIIDPLSGFKGNCSQLAVSIPLLRLLSEIYPIRNSLLALNVQIPTAQPLTQKQPYTFQLLSLISVEKCESISLIGEEKTVFPLTDHGTYYSAEVTPELVLSHPDLWQFSVAVLFQGKVYSFSRNISTQIPFSTNIQRDNSSVDLMVDTTASVVNSLGINWSSPNATLTVITPNTVINSGKILYHFPLNISQSTQGLYELDILLHGGIPSNMVNSTAEIPGIAYHIVINNTDEKKASNPLESGPKGSFTTLQFIWMPSSIIIGIVMVVQSISVRKKLALMTLQ